jgi:hypothetical protein
MKKIISARSVNHDGQGRSLKQKNNSELITAVSIIAAFAIGIIILLINYI